MSFVCFVVVCLLVATTTPLVDAFGFSAPPRRTDLSARHGICSTLGALRDASLSCHDDRCENSRAISDTTSPNDTASGRRGFLLSAACAVTAATTTLSATGPSWAAMDPVTTAATCDATVSVWRRGNRLVYLLGTAHISEVSAQLAGRLVQDTHPDAVFVELDLRRVSGGKYVPVDPQSGIVSTRLAVDPTGGASSSSSVVIPRVVPVSERNGGFLPTSAALATAATDGVSSLSSSLVETSSTTAISEATTTPSSSSQPNWFRRTLTDWGAALVGKAIRGLYSNLGQAGFNPGEEFVVAINQGQAMGSDIVLGDQDVQITLRRLSQALAVSDLNALADPNSDLERSMRELFGGQDPNQSLQQVASQKSTQEMKQELTSFVETMKSRDKVRQIMGELKQIAPALVQVMLTERDAYMAMGLDSLQNYEVITAVMGIAHQDGIERNLQSFGWKPVRLNCPVKQAL